MSTLDVPLGIRLAPRLRVGMPMLVKLLFAADLMLAALYVATLEISRYRQLHFTARLFDLDREANLPVWFSSMCQISRPPPGSWASYSVRWRFSSRKYSGPDAPFCQTRWTFRLVFTSGMLIVPLDVTFVTVAQPWFTLHQADGCAGTSPPPFHDPPPIRHQLPTPSDVLSVS